LAPIIALIKLVDI